MSNGAWFVRVGCDFFHANLGFCFGIAVSHFNNRHYSNAGFGRKKCHVWQKGNDGKLFPWQQQQDGLRMTLLILLTLPLKSPSHGLLQADNMPLIIEFLIFSGREERFILSRVDNHLVCIIVCHKWSAWFGHILDVSNMHVLPEQVVAHCGLADSKMSSNVILSLLCCCWQGNSLPSFSFCHMWLFCSKLALE